MRLLHVGPVLALSTVVLAGPKPSHSKVKFNWDAVRYVYAFGDSYSFIQGTLGHANYSFIGDELHPTFSPQQLLSNQIIPRNTSSEGSNWLEYLTGCFSGLPSKCSKHLYDFAFAGADISGDLLPLHHDYTLSLVRQVWQWDTYAANVLPHPPEQTLTFWWIGINDTGDTVNNATVTDFRAFWAKEMTAYFEAVEVAYNHGLLNHVFLNVPPGGRAPASNGNSTKAALQNEHIILYNEALTSSAANFARTHPDGKVILFDAYSWFNNVLDNPKTYNFTNVTAAPSDPRDTTGYFWYNSGHPTEAVHKLLASAIKTELYQASR